MSHLNNVATHTCKYTVVRLYIWFAHSTLIEMLIKQSFWVHIRILRLSAETSGGMLVHCDNNRQLYSRTGNNHIVTSTNTLWLAHFNLSSEAVGVTVFVSI